MAQRQLHGEDAALALRAARGHGATVQPGELLHQREPDAAALHRARRRARHAVEALEEAGQLVRGDARAGVLHLQRHPLPVLAQAQRDAALERELERVGDQVEDDLLPQVRRHVDGLGQRRAVHRELEARALHGGAEAGRRVLRQRGQVRGHEALLLGARLQLRQVQERVHQLEQAPGVAVHPLHLLADLVRQGARTPGEQVLRGAQHQRQRRAELVADVGEELRLEPVQLAQLLVRHAQLLVGLLDLLGAPEDFALHLVRAGA